MKIFEKKLDMILIDFEYNSRFQKTISDLKKVKDEALGDIMELFGKEKAQWKKEVIEDLRKLQYNPENHIWSIRCKCEDCRKNNDIEDLIEKLR